MRVIPKANDPTGTGLVDGCLEGQAIGQRDSLVAFRRRARNDGTEWQPAPLWGFWRAFEPLRPCDDQTAMK